jgi:tetratricopeptide (TPR) repeat protein
MKGDIWEQLFEVQRISALNWTATLDMLEPLEDTFQSAICAAAVPHWFDAHILAALLGGSRRHHRRLWETLTRLPFVEKFETRAGHNVHPLMRLAILTHLGHNRGSDYRVWTERAANYFAGKNDPEWQVERVYHLLVADPEKAADRVRDFYNVWPLDRTLENGMCRASTEHLVADRTHGRARAWSFFCLASVYLREEAYKPARWAIRRALSLKGKDETLEAHSKRLLGAVHYFLDEHRSAVACYSEAIATYRGLKSARSEALSLQRLGEVYQALSDFEPARKHYEEALALFAQVKDAHGEAHCLASLGDIDLMRGRYVKADERQREALGIFTKLGSAVGQANCIMRLGDVASALANYSKAESRYHEAIARFQNLPARRGVANCMLGLGSVFTKQGRLTEAGENLLAALDIFETKLEDRLSAAGCYRTLGDIAFERGELSEATRLYQKALRDYEGIPNRLGQASTLVGLGNAWLERPQYKRASEFYVAAKALYRSIEHTVGRADCDVGFGRVAIRSGQWSRAQRLLENALNIYREEQVRFEEANALQWLGFLDLARGHPDSPQYRKALELFESIGAKNAAESVRSLQRMQSIDERQTPLLSAN